MGDTTIQGTDKIRNVPSGILMGRTTTGIGRGENLSAATARSLLSVYQKTEVDALLAGKSPTGHQHAISDVSGLSAALGGKADLIGGLVPSSQLPSYVDDVLEFANLAAFPVSGESGKIYVAVDTSRTYRWSGSAYVELTDATAVWGSISGTLANQTDLQTALNAKANVSHNQAWGTITGTPTTLAGYGITDGITAVAVAAGYQPLDADLTAIAALSTTAFGRSLLTQSDAAAVRTVIGAGTSSFDGAFSSLTGRPTTLAGYGITDAAASSHTHGNITNAGAIGGTAGLPIITGASGVLQAGSFGSTAGTFCQGNDARLSDARTPLSHTHLQSDVTGLTSALAAKADLVGGLVPANQLPSFVDDVLEFANLAAFPATGESGKIYVALDTSRTYRWGGSTYAELTDSTAVWGSISGVLANQTDLALALSGKSDTGHTHSYASLTGIPSTFTPSVHKASHAVGGADALSPSDIGAVPTSRTLTINGTAFDLSANRSWTVSGGISSLNALTDATQTLAVGTSGTDFAIVSASGVHTFNLPSASATARGVVTTGTQTFAGVKTFNNDVRINGTLDFNTDNYFTYRLVIGFASGASRLTFHSINANGSGWGTVNAINGWADGSSWWCKVGGGAWGFGTGIYGYTHGFGSPVANTTRLHGGTNPQVFTVANTYTSETSFELVSIGWASNVCTIGVGVGSAGGSVRALQITGCPSTSAGLGTAGSVTVSGGVYSGADTAGVNGGSVIVSTGDLSGVGLSRPGDITLQAGSVTGNRSSTSTAAAGHILGFAGNAITSIEQTNSNAVTNGGRIDFTSGSGGSTAAVSAIASAGGRFYALAGAGGLGTSSGSTGGTGGAAIINGGAGGAGVLQGGNGGSALVRAGNGAAGSGTTASGGRGGQLNLYSGSGAGGTAGGVNGDGGSVIIGAGIAGVGAGSAGIDGVVIFFLSNKIQIQMSSSVFQVFDTSFSPYAFAFGTAYGTKIGSAANQKLALWGATPIVQPTTGGASATVASPGAGNTVKTDDTFDGYTLAQVVKALRNAGVLA